MSRYHQHPLCSCRDCCARLQLAPISSAQAPAMSSSGWLGRSERQQQIYFGSCETTESSNHTSTTSVRHGPFSPMASWPASGAPWDQSLLQICTCVGCDAQLHGQVEQLAHAMTEAARRRESLAARIDHLRQLSQCTLRDVARVASVERLMSLDSNLRGRAPGPPKRKRPKKYSAGPWPSQITSNTTASNAQVSLTAYCSLLSSSKQLKE